jgi:hypothetical protein
VVSYPALIELQPEFREFIRPDTLVHRGDVLAFRPNVQTACFSTDEGGFRRTMFDQRSWSVAEIVAGSRYGIVLGSSNIFGLGLAGDENTLASLLSARFGFPFAGITLPEGNSRSLFALLTAFAAKSSAPPAVVIHFNGGDFTGCTYSSLSDAVFGAPNLKQLPMAEAEIGTVPPVEAAIPRLLAFSNLWTRGHRPRHSETRR